MTIIDEILPKVKAEVRLDKANKTLWIKTDTLDGYGRVIIEDGSNWCRVFYEDKTESNSEKPNNCEDAYPCDTCRHNKLEWYSEICDSCCGNNNHYEPKDEPQTERSE